MMAGWAMGTEAWIWMGAWALVMVLVVWLLVREPRSEAHDAREILQARYARGEISEEELRRAIRALTDDPPAARVPSRSGAATDTADPREATHE